MAEPVAPCFNTFEVCLVHDCNLRCRYCSTGFGRWGQKSIAMTPEVVEKTIDFIMRASGDRLRVVLSGGENLINVDLFSCFIEKLLAARASAGKRVRIELATNGSLMSPQISDFLLRNKVSVIFSLDGDAFANDRNRRFPDGKGTYSAVLTNIHRYKNLQASLFPEQAIYLRADCTVDAQSDCYTAVHHLFDVGFTEVLVRPALASAYTGWKATSDERQFVDSYSRLLDDVLAPLEPVAFLTGRWAKMVSNAVGPLNHILLNKPIGKDCGALHRSVCIRADGVLVPCFMFNGGGYQQWRIGDVKTGVDPMAVQQVRNLLEASLPDCDGCDEVNACGRGCPLRFYEESKQGRLKTAYSACRFQKIISPVVREAGEKLAEKNRSARR
jgi:uncharacterized protein